MPKLYLDTETTGFHNQARIIEIAILDDRRQRVFSSLIDPGQHIPYEITKVTGISNEMIRGKPMWRDIRSNVANLVRGATIVCHNAAFDIRMLSNHGVVPAGHICTMAEAKRLLPGLKGYKLAELAVHLGIDLSQNRAHRAEADAMACALVHEALVGIEQTRVVSAQISREAVRQTAAAPKEEAQGDLFAQAPRR